MWSSSGLPLSRSTRNSSADKMRKDLIVVGQVFLCPKFEEWVMKRIASLMLACVCLMAFLVSECNADCSGSKLGDRIQSGLSKVVGVPKKIRQAVQSKVQKAASCGASAASCSGAASCSAPAMSCSAPAVVPVASVEPVAQHKANVQAGQGRMRHIGGSLGAGRYEGVGFSTVSADAAIKACCYYNSKQIVDSGVAYGYSKQHGMYGWFATNLYR